MEPKPYGPFTYSPIVDRPPLKWPKGARLAVWVVVNVEFFPLNIDYPLPIPGEKPMQPNYLVWPWRDYGNRVGIWRMMDMLSKCNIRATAALNSDICIQHPRIVEASQSLGWELMAHGERNTLFLHHYEASEERAAIARSFSTIEKASGRRPTGWLGPGLLQSWKTLEFLAAEGCKYVGDFANDDQPYLLETVNPALVAVPYTNELNDTIMVNRKNYTPEAFAELIRRQFDVLYDESATSGRVLTIALHPYVTGVPHAIRSIEAALRYVAQHDDVWLATGQEITDAFLGATATPTTAG